MTWQLDATALSALLDAREVTPLQLLDQALERLDALEPVLNAFTHVDRDGALAAATAATARQAAGARLGPLDGIPVSVKDNIFVARPARPMGQPAVPRSHPGPRRYLRGTAACRRRRHRRQDHDAGTRHVGPHRQPVVGHHPQSVGSRLTPEGPRAEPRRPSPPGSRRSRSAPTWAAARGCRPPIPVWWVCGPRPGGFRAGSGFRPPAIDFQVIGPFARTMRDMRLLYGVLSGPDPRDPYSQRFPPAPDVTPGRSIRIGWFTAIGR